MIDKIVVTRILLDMMVDRDMLESELNGNCNAAQDGSSGKHRAAQEELMPHKLNADS